MTASTTHEVRNVLAIIKESAGLVGDLVRLYEKRGTLDPAKFHRSTERIDLQVKRGAEHLTQLNRLSHALDRDRASLDLREEIRLHAFLCGRIVRRRGMEVDAADGDPVPSPPLPALRLQMVLHAAVGCCLEQLPAGSRILLAARKGGEGAEVAVTGEPMEGEGVPSPLEAPGWEPLRALAAQVGGEAAPGESGYGITIRFRNEAQGK
jgi:hypothetical protein